MQVRGDRQSYSRTASPRLAVNAGIISQTSLLCSQRQWCRRDQVILDRGPPFAPFIPSHPLTSPHIPPYGRKIKEQAEVVNMALFEISNIPYLPPLRHSPDHLPNDRSWLLCSKLVARCRVPSCDVTTLEDCFLLHYHRAWERWHHSDVNSNTHARTHTHNFLFFCLPRFLLLFLLWGH